MTPQRVSALQRVLGLALVVLALAVGLSYAPDRPVETLVARWAPYPSNFVELDGLVVHYRDEGPRGDGTPIVLIHGTSASLHTWEGWVTALKPTHRVISFDLPGFGLTGPNTSGDYRGDSYARFVLKLMDRLQVQRFIVGGNSLGGEVAWRTAALAPERVAQLILVDAAGYRFKPESLPIGFWVARTPVLNWGMDYLTPRSVVERSVQDVYGDPAKVTRELVDRYYELTLREGNRHALAQRFRQQVLGEDAGRIATLKLPTLILWGGRDRLIPSDSAEHFHRDIAGSRLVIFPALGHVPQEEDPAATVQPVLEFTAQRPAVPAPASAPAV